MKSYVITTAVVVAAHAALAVLWPPYFRLLIDCGDMVSGGNDVADLPRLWLLGTMIVGLGWVVLANGLAAVIKKAT